jgi:type II secretory pathway component GspD/PulD (secretin)
MRHTISMHFRSLILCSGIAASALLPIRAAAAPITLDIRELDIYDAVRLLSTQTSTNLVLDASVAHRPVTLHLHALDFDEALSAFIRVNELAVARVGKVIYLGTPDAINRRYAPLSSSGARTRVFFPKNTPAEALAKQLADALPQGTLVVADRRTASVIVTASDDVVDRAAQLTDLLDRRSAAGILTTPLRYLKAADAVRALQATLSVVPPSSVYAVEQQNAVLATGPDDFLERVAETIARIDRPGRQVRYEVRVTDISPSESSNVGFTFGGLSLSGQPVSGQATTTFVSNSIALNATINAMVAKGEASILAQPSLSTLNNVQASLLVGQQFPIVYFDARTGTQQVQFANVGVNLIVLPNVGADGSITTDLETDYSTIVNFVAGFPVIGTRRAQSTLRVQDGETIVIAGLFQDLDATTVSKVPLLADIPIFGDLFRNRTKTHVKDEVVFLITPHLVPDQAARP